MSNEQWDIRLDGTDYRVERGWDRPGYTRSWVRKQVVDQQIRRSGRFEINSRGERSVEHQTNWDQGSAWWDPVLSADTLAMYGTASTNFDCFSRPGAAVPISKPVTSSGVCHIDGEMITVDGDTYVIGDTKTTDATYWDVYKWTPGSDDWVRETGYSSGEDGTNFFGAAYRAADGYVYVMSGEKIARFNPATSAQNSAWQSVAAQPGDAIFVDILGNVFIYESGKIQQLNLGGPSLTDIVDDGLGADMMAAMADPAAPHLEQGQVRLATADAGGIFYVKNVLAQGVPRAYLSRVDRDQSGAYIRYPLAALPAGVVVLNIIRHLGSTILVTTPDWKLALANDRSTGEYPRIDLYHHTDGHGIGVLGSPDRSAPTELPAFPVGGEGSWMYLGSNQRVWVYDGRTGGLHPWLDIADLTDGVVSGFARATNSSGEQIMLLRAGDVTWSIKTHAANPDTVASFGDDLTHYTLTSAYIDGGLPFEEKTLLEIDVRTELMTANQQYTIQIQVDDGAWVTRATHTGAIRVSNTDVSSASLSGKRFRYRIIYETKDATIVAFQGLQLTFGQGEMIPKWQLLLGAFDIHQVQNEIVDPKEKYEAFIATAAKSGPVTLIDRYQSLEADDTETLSVTISEASVIKGDAGEDLFYVELEGW